MIVSFWFTELTLFSLIAKQFSDGCLDLIMIKDCRRLSLLKSMTELNNGGHVKSSHTSYLKVSLLNDATFDTTSFIIVWKCYILKLLQVKGFILQPGSRTNDPNKGGIIDVDGEVLARGKGVYKCEENTLMSYDKLQIQVDQGLATLFAPNSTMK